MKTNIIFIALVGLLSMTNIIYGFSKSKPTIYTNKIKNANDNSTTISLFEGVNDKELKPIKQYTIKNNAQGMLTEKVEYSWDGNKKTWIITDKYEYVYNTGGKLEAITHSTWDQKTGLWINNMRHELFMFEINKELLSVNDNL